MIYTKLITGGDKEQIAAKNQFKHQTSITNLNKSQKEEVNKMKKTLVFILSLVLAIGFGATAFAMHGASEGFEYTPAMVTAPSSAIEFSGEIRVRGDFQTNTTGDSKYEPDDDNGDTRATFDQRARIKLKATVSPNTMGVIELETGDSNSDSYAWGGGEYGSGAKGSMGVWERRSLKGNYKPEDMHIRQAYIAHQGTDLGMLTGFKIGHILVKLGNGLFYNHAQYGDDGMVAWMQPSKGSELSFTYLKLEEDQPIESDDLNLYNLGYETHIGGADSKNHVEINLTYIDGQNGLRTCDGGCFIDDGIHGWNIGLAADTMIEGISLYGDLEIQGGSAESSNLPDEVEFNGYAWMVGASADIPDSPASLHVEAAYGSGQNREDNVIDNGIDMFLTSLSAGQKYTLVYEYTVPAAGFSSTNTGLANTWYINVGGDIDLSPDVNFAADYYYLKASEDVFCSCDDTDHQSNSIGQELDGKLTYQIDTNLVYYIEAGILFAGDVYNTYQYGDHMNADNPYRIRHGMVLSF
jgi:hypothetical protein